MRANAFASALYSENGNSLLSLPGVQWYKGALRCLPPKRESRQSGRPMQGGTRAIVYACRQVCYRALMCRVRTLIVPAAHE